MTVFDSKGIYEKLAIAAIQKQQIFLFHVVVLQVTGMEYTKTYMQNRCFARKTFVTFSLLSSSWFAKAPQLDGCDCATNKGSKKIIYWASFPLSKMADSRKRRVTIKSLCLLLLLILIFPLQSLFFAYRDRPC